MLRGKPLWAQQVRNDRRVYRTSTPSTVLLSVVLVLSGAGALLIVSILVVDAIQPLAASDPHSPLDVALSPESSLLTALLVGLLAVCFFAYWWPRRSQPRPFSLVAGLGLTSLAFTLGLASYWNCTETQSHLWAPIAWTLALFVGTTEAADGCSPDEVTALQVARLFALCATFLSVALAVSSLTRNQWDRLRARLAPAMVLVTGLTDDTVSFIRVLAHHMRRPGLVVVVEPDPGHPLIPVIRSHGACVVTGEPTHAPHLATVTGKQLRRLRAAYLLSPDLTANLRVVETIRGLSAGATPDPGVVPPRLMLRVDDPAVAEDWRRRHIGDLPDLLLDVTGVNQATAQGLVDRVVSERAGQLVILGSSSLTLAILDELALRQREWTAAGTSRPLETTVIDVEGDVIVSDHDVHQSRYGNTVAASQRVRVVAASPTLDSVAPLLGDTRTVVINASAPSEDAVRLSQRIALRSRECIVLSRSATARDISHQPLMGNLYEFGLSLLPTDQVPQDAWERTARQLHESYRHQQPPSAERPSHRPWDELDDFYQQTNIRQVVTVLRAVVQRGWTWAPSAAHAREVDMTVDDIDAIARTEHQSWVSYHRRKGWRHHPVRNDERKQHPDLVGWDELPESERDTTRGGVVEALRHLRTLGYRPYDPAPVSGVDRPELWRDFRRHGRVTAERRDAAWSWQTEGGDSMQAEPGDWWVQDSAGNAWSVRPADFELTYTHLSGNHWERSGTVRARKAREGEQVITSEGTVVARSADWILENGARRRWVVPEAMFVQNYRPVPPASEHRPAESPG